MFSYFEIKNLSNSNSTKELSKLEENKLSFSELEKFEKINLWTKNKYTLKKTH